MFFFIGPSPIIAYCLPLSVTNSLKDCCLVDLTKLTLFEDANSKLLDGISVADVDAEERVDDSLDEILRLRFGRDFPLIPQY